MDSCFKSPPFIGVLTFFLTLLFSSSDAYDPLDPTANITIKWDIFSWTADGYVAAVTINNFQQYRRIQSPGWKLGWVWAKKEVIWTVIGAQATEQGDCSKFKSDIPHCCKKNPTIVDLLPGVPCNRQFYNCCRGGVINAWGQDPSTSVSSFQISVGQSGNTNKTVKVPKNFTLSAPGPGGYSCAPAKIVTTSKFKTADGKRTTEALMTWKVTCTYSQILSQRTPSCCVSLSSLYNDTVVPCPTCSCGCQNNTTRPRSCVEKNSSFVPYVVPNPPSNSYTPLVRCTNHMCPIRIHWHVKMNYKEHWRVKVTIMNFNYRGNYSQWNLVLQHPNLDNLTQIFGFNYKFLNPYANIKDDIVMLWGVKFYNDSLIQAGHTGNVHGDLLFRKDKASFTFEKGWAFPRRVYFNGDNCVMPPPDAYTYLAN